MPLPQRPIAFVLTSTDHGTMILNRFDYRRNTQTNDAIGIGLRVLSTSSYHMAEADMVKHLLAIRRRHHGDGVIALDCGANIGAYTIEWAKFMTGWGEVLAVEAQERIFYALAGNIAINNCFNARALHAAVAGRDGTLRMPVPNYAAPGSFASLELRQRPNNEFIGQPVDYGEPALVDVRTLAIDGLGLRRLDFLKIDVEGMELEVLEGAGDAISRCRPIMMVEFVKVGLEALSAALHRFGYRMGKSGMNLIAVHRDDPSIAQVRLGT